MFSERLFRTMADLVVSEGYAAVGYEYINVDDCWLDKERNANGELQPDLSRFPRGMRDLSNYVIITYCVRSAHTYPLSPLVDNFCNKKLLIVSAQRHDPFRLIYAQ